jgi:hypothetical protein
MFGRRSSLLLNLWVIPQPKIPSAASYCSPWSSGGGTPVVPINAQQESVPENTVSIAKRMKNGVSKFRVILKTVRVYCDDRDIPNSPV